MKKLMIALLGIILIAGCIDGGTTVTTDGYGLEITNFSSNKLETYSDSSVRLTVEVENLGETKVDDDDALVYLIGTNINFDDESGFSWGSVDFEELYQEFDRDMDPADPVRNISADKKTFYWRLNSPSLTPGQTRTDKFYARVYYEYETIARGTVWVYSEAEDEAIRSIGGAYETSSFNSTKGPVSVEVIISPDPAIVIDRGDTFMMELKLKNVGGGIVYKPNAVNYNTGNVALVIDELNHVNIDISNPGLDVTGCEGDQEIIGSEMSIICDVTVDSVPATKKGYSPQIKIIYGYYSEAETSVKVLGR
ncbi:MAG: hypothetical protein ACW99Q_19365 [Candidatus Kariarchaeaceae archaeon]|jgi:hypothetical protein